MSLHPFETSAIKPGRLYKVRASCTFGLKLHEIDGEGRSEFTSVEKDTILLALGCWRQDTLEEPVMGSQFIFKFLMAEEEVYLPLTSKMTFERHEMHLLHEELQKSLELFVKPLDA